MNALIMSAASPFTSNSISKFASSPLVLRNGVFRAQFWGKSSRFRASSNGLDKKVMEDMDEGLGDSAETKVEDEQEIKGANSISNGAASTTISPALDKELKKIIRRARAEFRIVEEREDFVLCYIHRKKEDEEEEEEDDESTLEQGGTSSKDFEAVPVPVPVETTTLRIAEGSNDDDDISSYFVGVPMETAIAKGVPVETLLAPTDNNNSYIVGIPVDTIAEGVPVETLLAPPAGNMDTVTDGGSYISCGVPVDTSSEPDSFMDFNKLIWNIEDVTTLIDLDA